MMRFIFGWLGRLILVVAVPVVLALVGWLIAGRFDASPSIETQACQRPEPETIPAEENAYFALVGLHAADPAADINDVGRAMLAEYLETVRENPNLEEYKFPQELEVVGQPRQLCQPLVGSCLKTSLESAARIRQVEQDNALLLNRYYSLYSYSRFHEMAPAHGSSPLLSYGSTLHYLASARIALQASEGQREMALEALARDTAFWRVILRDGYILSKAVATRVLMGNVQQLSDILSSEAALSAEEQSYVDQILAPLSDTDRDLAPAIRREFCIYGNSVVPNFNNGVQESRVSRGTEGRWRPVGDFLLSGLLRPNHTMNLAQERATALLAGDTPEPRHFGDSWWDYAYNPAGKYLVYDFAPDAATFQSRRDRLNDLDGLLRLVSLQWMIKRESLRKEGIPAFLQANEVLAHNSATGQRIQWDETRSVLWLARLGARQGEQAVFEAPRE